MDRQNRVELTAEMFDRMRTDADRILNKMLKNMVEKDTMEGSVTIKIDCRLMPEYVKNPEDKVNELGETRRILRPRFDHKISSAMQIKDDAKGESFSEMMELVYDDATKEYVLAPITGGQQMNIFDFEKKDNDQIELGARSFPALPAPEAGYDDENAQEGAEGQFDDESEVVDAEYREVAETDAGASGEASEDDYTEEYEAFDSETEFMNPPLTDDEELENMDSGYEYDDPVAFAMNGEA